MNQTQDVQVAIDFMDENICFHTEAMSAVREFHRLIQELDTANGNSPSLDLSLIGMPVCEAMALENRSALASIAQSKNCEIMIRAEGPKRTDISLRIYLQLSRNYPNLGITPQAYLHHTVLTCPT